MALEKVGQLGLALNTLNSILVHLEPTFKIEGHPILSAGNYHGDY
jgi:hypothetical protein